MNYVFLVISMITMVLKNCIFNTAGKNILKTNKDMLKFNSVMFALCAVAFLSLAFKESLSLYTISLGVIFGISTILSNTYTMKALASGAMHITVLITTSSMIIPTVFGMMLSDEPLNIYKMAAMAMLIGFIYLSSANEGEVKVSKKWVIYCIIAFLATGIIGILQKIHQTSMYKNELFGFLGCSFTVSFIFSFIISKKGTDTDAVKFTLRHYFLAFACGICVFTMNLINLKLSGIIPSQIFFPLVNGSSVIFSSLLSVFIFKERISKRQITGLVGGLASLILICLL